MMGPPPLKSPTSNIFGQGKQGRLYIRIIRRHLACGMYMYVKNKVETTNRCEAQKDFNIFKMCPTLEYLLVAHLPTKYLKY